MQFRSSSSENKNIEKEFKNLRKELLDLTLRNQLLSFKPRNKTLTIINQSPMNVYKTLVLENKKMHFSPNKKDSSEKSRFSSIWEHPPLDLSIFSEGDKNLKADLSPSELQKRLFYIDQQARTMLQEQGYNILYLAIGFLEWVDKKKPKQKNLAPLILIPVTMERIKVGNSFSISWTGEDLQTNISLQAKLRDDGIELPKFEPNSYIEVVDRYLKAVNDAVKPIKNWKVINNVALGFFSFTKFVMYNDLNPESWEDDVDLTKHGLIEAIFDPSKNVYEDSFSEEDVDKKLHYNDMYQVLDADSSQIAVIENVKSGHNLVVEGPPGTGKSQTIVNLIAELIAEGKTVLFVSEKMAALEVVKNRLDGVGLGKFVLELHSHKTRRKKLLKNLQRATNVRATNDLKINQTLRKLETLRDQLDDYAEIIHEPVYEVNLSPFQLYGMKESAIEYFSEDQRVLPLVRFNNPESVSLKDLDDIVISLESLAELYTTISKNNPWSKCNPDSLLPADLREIELLIGDSLDSLDQFRYETDFIKELYGIHIPETLKEYKFSIDALKLLDSNNSELIDSSILLNKEWYKHPERANDLIKLLERYQKYSSLLDKFDDYIFNVDLNNLIKDLEKDLNKKFHLFGGNSHKDELSRLYKTEIPSDKQAHKDLIAVNQVLANKKELDSYEQLGKQYFGELWHEKANINELQDVVQWMSKFSKLLSVGTFSESTIELFSKDLYNFDVENEMADYIEKGNQFTDNLSRLQAKLKPRSKLIFKKDIADVPFEKWENQLNEWRGQLSSLHLWSQYSNTKKSIMASPASIFVKTIEKRGVKKEDVKSLVLGNFADSLLNIVFSENDKLATFIGELHENRIKEFQDLDKKIINLNRKRIFNKLNKNIPKIFGGAEDPEAKILAGEFTRKSGHLPVRNLLERAGGMIKRIKPVFMMSPLSIAQYLDPTNPKLQFDVVIFDEASQVKPEDALGAFMRAKTAVVMGDTQQLPPTSFFDQMTDAESEEEVATALDMESILHLCKLSFPVKMLKWHYRSRHESLISVSNKEFYDNELLVYPSPSHNDSELGLKFKYNPNTAYYRGNSSANPGEAKEVVKEIFKHFEKYGDKKSLGVGTFSVAQKNAILEELEIERKSHPEYEPLFSDKKDERFFVKNLETIQGDERDVILMSVGYGYDTEGKMSLNFGPLNQDGGERRLNVLITRAREKCVVFANFKSHDIHLTANPPFGIKALKNFIEYAENISYGELEKEELEEAPFEDSVCSFLESNGYLVDKHIGCAGFRVDLAIIDEENHGKYILGIECDGKSYASSKVARDRDRLRQQVLKGLGWNLYHLWSTDWYRNRELAKSRLLEVIESTKVSTKLNEIKSELAAAESMKINPVTSFIIGKSEDNSENKSEENIDNIEDSNLIEESSDSNLNIMDMETEVANIENPNIIENTEEDTQNIENLNIIENTEDDADPNRIDIKNKSEVANDLDNSSEITNEEYDDKTEQNNDLKDTLNKNEGLAITKKDSKLNKIIKTKNLENQEDDLSQEKSKFINSYLKDIGSSKEEEIIKKYLEDIPESKNEKILREYLEDIPEIKKESSESNKDNNEHIINDSNENITESSNKNTKNNNVKIDYSSNFNKESKSLDENNHPDDTESQDNLSTVKEIKNQNDDVFPESKKEEFYDYFKELNKNNPNKSKKNTETRNKEETTSPSKNIKTKIDNKNKDLKETNKSLKHSRDLKEDHSNKTNNLANNKNNSSKNSKNSKNESILSKVKSIWTIDERNKNDQDNDISESKQKENLNNQNLSKKDKSESKSIKNVEKAKSENNTGNTSKKPLRDDLEIAIDNYINNFEDDNLDQSKSNILDDSKKEFVNEIDENNIDDLIAKNAEKVVADSLANVKKNNSQKDKINQNERIVKSSPDKKSSKNPVINKEQYLNNIPKENISPSKKITKDNNHSSIKPNQEIAKQTIPAQENQEIAKQTIPAQENQELPVQNIAAQENQELPVQNIAAQENQELPVQNIAAQELANDIINETYEAPNKFDEELNSSKDRNYEVGYHETEEYPVNDDSDMYKLSEAEKLALKATLESDDDEIINLTNPKNIEKYYNNEFDNIPSENIIQEEEYTRETQEQYTAEPVSEDYIEENINPEEYLRPITQESNLDENSFYAEETHNDKDYEPVHESSENNADDEFVYNPEEYIEKEYENSYSDGIEIYDSAIGIENKLKKNSVNLPQHQRRKHKLSVTESLSELKNEVLYLNASLKEIENPTERKDIYVIDRSNEEEYEYYNNSNENYYDEYNEDNYENDNSSIQTQEYSNNEYEDLNYTTEGTEDSNQNYQELANEDETTYQELTNENETNLDYEVIDESEKEYYEESKIENTEEPEEFIPLNNIVQDSHIEYKPIPYKNSQSKIRNSVTGEIEPGFSSISEEISSDDINIITEEITPDLTEDIPEEINNSNSENPESISKNSKFHFKKSSILDKYENSILMDNSKDMEDFIDPYEKAEDIDIKSVDELYNNSKKLNSVVDQIILEEGPIHIDELIRRVRENCNLSRAGSKFKKTIQGSIASKQNNGEIRNIDGFLFSESSEVKIRKRNKPNIDLISNIEIEQSINLVLVYNGAINYNELPKKVSRNFGFKSTSKKTANKINEVIETMLAEGKVINKNNTIRLYNPNN